jgi:uracil phosphoribosyltransferase
MIHILNHPLVQNDIRILRDKNTNVEAFRNATYRIGIHLAIESMNDIPVSEVDVITPIESTKASEINRKVVIIPVLRAGLALVNSFQTLYPNCVMGYIGLSRNEATFEPEEYYYSVPQVNFGDKVILLEVMLATGGSASFSLSKLQLEGINDMTLVSVISAPEGVEKIRTEFPNVKIITAALDKGLNENRYIVPGLGDAGDRYCR